jgi:DNA polymerase-3 subunit delta
VVKNPFTIGDELLELIKKWDLEKDQTRIFILVENQPAAALTKKNKKLFTLLTRDESTAKSFEPLEGKQLEAWAGKEIKALGCEIIPAALKKLISSVIGEGDENARTSASWQLKQEIDKLTNYKLACDGPAIIESSDIDLLVPVRPEFNIFEVIDAIANKNKARASTLFYNHIENGEDPYYFFSMIIYQFRNLLRIKSLAKNAVPYENMAHKTGFKPYVLRKTYEQSRRFDLEELKKDFAALAQIEIDAKTGNTDMADAIFGFIFSLNP